MLPGVIFELMKSDPDDVEFYDKIHELAASDPPLALFIIGYANSAASSPNHHIDGLKSALTRVGAKTIYQLLTTLTIAKVFIPQKKEQKDLWRHSIEVATIASFLSRTTVGLHVQAETAYIAGLLHDIGRFVLFQVSPFALEETEAQGWSSPTELVSIEEKTVGFTHAKIGYLACQKLNVPNLIGSVARYHHHYNLYTHPKAPKTLKELSLLIQLADEVSVLIMKDDQWRNLPVIELERKIQRKCLHNEWKLYRLPIPQLAQALPALIEKSEAIADNLGL